jgi:uncharacterized protein (TIGR02246 family)
MLALAWAVFILSGAPANAYEPTAEETKAVDEALENWVVFYNKHDPKALTQLYAEDSQLIIETGEKFKGREAIEKVFSENFAKNPRISSRLFDVSRSFLTPEIVLENGAWEDSNLTEAGRSTTGFYTTVYAKRDGAWLIVHDHAWVPTKQPAPSQ